MSLGNFPVKPSLFSLFLFNNNSCSHSHSRPVDKDQILLRNISVMYYGLSCRIEISKVVMGEIKDLVSFQVIL